MLAYGALAVRLFLFLANVAFAILKRPSFYVAIKYATFLRKGLTLSIIVTDQQVSFVFFFKTQSLNYFTVHNTDYMKVDKQYNIFL